MRNIQGTYIIIFASLLNIVVSYNIKSNKWFFFVSEGGGVGRVKKNNEFPGFGIVLKSSCSD